MSRRSSELTMPREANVRERHDSGRMRFGGSGASCRWLVGRTSNEARHAPVGGSACRLSPAAALMAVNTGGDRRSREFVEDRLGRSQVGRIEALGKPVVNLDQ
jgi:hypothetical protein